MKKKYFKARFYLSLILLGFFLFGFLLYCQSLKGYRLKELPFESTLADSLAIFEYNQSQHNDPVAGCWYDSGDYIVLLPRNAESLFYLSMAYQYAPSSAMKRDLQKVIDSQLICVEAMIHKNLKQFRDQDSHGIHLPPQWNEHIYPSNTYPFKAEEGGDVFLMLSLIYGNMGDDGRALFYKKKADGLTLTPSENCCEWGPIVLEDVEWKALQALNDAENQSTPERIWGSQFTSLLTLKQKSFHSIQGLFYFLEQDWKGAAWPFEYLGGNYDMAGTITLERLYAKETGDDSHKDLSDRLYAYLTGKNDYDFDFTRADYIYHPCYFFKVCFLKDTLINGIHEAGQKKMDRSWQSSEVQLVGQAQYVLMKVLYLNGRLL